MVKSLETILTRKGLVDPKAINTIIDLYSHEIGPQRGAELVAKCWVDPAFKGEFLADTDRVLRGMGYSGRQGEHVKIIENTLTRITWSFAHYAAVIHGHS